MAAIDYPIYVSTANRKDEKGNDCYAEIILNIGLPSEVVVYRTPLFKTHSLATANCDRHIKKLMKLHKKYGEPF